MRTLCAWRCASSLAAALCLAIGTTSVTAEEWLRPKSPLRVARALQSGDEADAFAGDAPPAATPRRAVPDPESQGAEDLESMTLKDAISVSDEGGSYGNEFVGRPGPSGRSGRFFGGADYLYVRASFSQAPAYLQIDGFGGNTTETLVPHDFDYQSSVRAYAGWYWAECGVDVMFGYTNLSSNADQFSGVTPGNFDPFYSGHQEVTTTPGDRIHAFADVNINAFDLGISKTLCLGGCDTSCSPCQDQCGSCNDCCRRPCAPWDLTWSLSARLVDAGWNNASEVVNGAGVVTQVGSTAMSFDGAGPRVGLGARRYMGGRQQFSLFANGHMSVLLGDYEIVGTQVQPGDIDIRQMSCTRIIPVTEIEVGGSWQVSRRATLSGGYLFQAWHDLGMSDEFGGNLPPFDDANILGFDGFFARAELAF